MVEYNVNGWIIKPSTRKNKKYDVFKNGDYITSFGDLRYQHFKDRFGYYSHLDHNDEERAERYRKRAKALAPIANPYKANFWAYWYLWN
jgi:hypothetical protein